MNVLKVTQLHKHYGDVAALRDVSVELAAGQFCGLFGANGSGKSTLMRCITGIDRPDQGQVEICGLAMSADPVGAKARIGYAVDVNRLPNELSGRQCLQLVAQVRGAAAIERETLRLAELIELAPWLDAPVAGYSLGTRQKLSVTLGLIGTPPLILLDESLNGLDPVASLALKTHLLQLTRERGCTILLATHAMDAVDWWDRALLLDRTLVRTWESAELRHLRSLPGASLEREVVAALSTHRGAPPASTS